MKVIFMGTPDFAVNSLEAVVKAGHEVVLVVTQPDKPKGRGKNVQFTPVKECALNYNIPVFQPAKIREAAAVEELKKYEADIFVVVAFGQILPKEILEMPKYGCINVHASLLPKYRGAAPIQWAVIDGEEKTGITVQRMDEGVDTGDIILKTELMVEKEETGGSLFEKLADTGAKSCVEAMKQIANKTASYTPQDHEEATYAGMLTKKLGNIDWNLSAVEIERLIRGLNPWPSAYTYLDGKTLKIWKASVKESVAGVKPGFVAGVSAKELIVQTGNGALSLEEVQLEGKKRMNVADFLRGYQIEENTEMKRNVITG